MYSVKHLNFNRLGLVAALSCMLAAGCPGGQSPDAALDKAMSDAGKAKGSVYPLAGKVTIDGQPPKFDKPSYQLVVTLNEADKLDVPPVQRPHVVANAKGDFSFATYKVGDGVRPGKYIVTFEVFQHKQKLGLIPPDHLNNLYNDPDVNAKKPEFVIDHKSPGKRDYDFNLQVSGKEAAEAGPHAVTNMLDSGDPGAGKYNKRK